MKAKYNVLQRNNINAVSRSYDFDLVIHEVNQFIMKMLNVVNLVISHW